jgi:sigma-E factor negative regulatory protein RseA
MTGQINDQISAFADDELSPDECEFLVRRLEKDPECREKVLRYSVIGASLRGEILAPHPDVLRERLKRSFDGASLVARAPTSAPKWTSRLLKPVAGAAIAAGVAGAALLVLSNSDQLNIADGTAPLVAQQTTIGDANNTVPSYIVPQNPENGLGVPEPIIQSPIRLTNYLVRHGEYAFGIGRTSIHSSVVSGQDTWRVAEDEMAEE